MFRFLSGRRGGKRAEVFQEDFCEGHAVVFGHGESVVVRHLKRVSPQEMRGVGAAGRRRRAPWCDPRRSILGIGASRSGLSGV